jgi:thiamine transporter
MVPKGEIMKNRQKIASLVEIGMFVAIAVVLDVIAGFLFELPNGGSVSIAMLPIFVISYRRGWQNGVIAGAGFGLIQTMIKVYFLSLPQYLLEYLVAFMVVGLAGLFRNALEKPIPFTLGILLGGFLRYIVASVVGILYWKAFIPDEILFMNQLFAFDLNSVFSSETAIIGAGSLLYNALYMVPSTLLCLVVGLALQRRQILSLNLKTLSETEKS